MFDVWQTIVPGEEHVADTSDPRSHYWREHYLATEADYHRRLADQREERLAHYRLTGKILPPQF